MARLSTHRLFTIAVVTLLCLGAFAGTAAAGQGDCFDCIKDPTSPGPGDRWPEPDDWTPAGGDYWPEPDDWIPEPDRWIP